MHLEEHDKTSSLDQAAVTFAQVRPRLFGIAYRMLAGSAEAEDIVQETWLRWHNIERSTIVNPAAFLALITTRLCINAAQSARVRRETHYIGPWLPEPIDTSTDPAAGAERGEALELALLLLLEKLTPAQRAAYILREAFDYPYEQIAEIIQLSPSNVRQLVSRARKRLNTTRRGSIDTDEHRRLLSTFLDAAQKGNVTALEDLFAADVVSSSDGNGITGTVRSPLICSDRWRDPPRRIQPFWPAPTSPGTRRTAVRACSSPARTVRRGSPSTPHRKASLAVGPVDCDGGPLRGSAGGEPAS